ncbi:MAG: signal peptidase II, partial [Kiritimatiellae bacterium]|nr:signal peptidase II [Kiritimatiellia bacterium]
SHFPCFNFADTCICVGAGMIVLASLLTPRRRKEEKEAAP